MKIRVKRAYEPPARADGKRVLVERLWPRGLTRARAAIDLWLKSVAPTPELRKWFAHDPAKWSEFKRRYRHELRDSGESVDELRRLCRRGTVTLVYGARDEQHNSAIVLAKYLQEARSGKTRARRAGVELFSRVERPSAHPLHCRGEEHQ